MHRKSTAKGVLGLLRNPAVGGLVAIGLFEVLLRLRVPSEAAAVVLGITMFPALVIGLAGRVGALARERDSHAATLWLAFADVAIAICFFAFLYLELGIYAAGDPGRDVSSYLTCLYFSASTLTNAGLGDFLPRPEARFVAVVEMMFGYVALGMITSASFFLLVRRRVRPEADSGPRHP